jgi:hypothetical protein
VSNIRRQERLGKENIKQEEPLQWWWLSVRFLLDLVDAQKTQTFLPFLSPAGK